MSYSSSQWAKEKSILFAAALTPGWGTEAWLGYILMHQHDAASFNVYYSHPDRGKSPPIKEKMGHEETVFSD